MLSNFTLQFHYGTPIWILTDDNLSHSFKQQLKSLRGKNNQCIQLLNIFVNRNISENFNSKHTKIVTLQAK